VQWLELVEAEQRARAGERRRTTGGVLLWRGCGGDDGAAAGQLALLAAGERRQGEGERNEGGAGADGSRRHGAAWWGRRACHPYAIAGERRPRGGRLLPRSAKRARGAGEADARGNGPACSGGPKVRRTAQKKIKTFFFIFFHK
jgi:hypothetical protein